MSIPRAILDLRTYPFIGTDDRSCSPLKNNCKPVLIFLAKKIPNSEYTDRSDVASLL